LSFRKYALLVVAVSVALSIAIAAGCIALHESARSEVLGRIKTAESGRVRHQAAALRDDLRRAISDLRALTESRITQEFLDSPGPQTTKAIQDHFLLTAQSTGLYDQIRIIDSDGAETVRINYNAGSPAVVGPADLQDKKNRYYFTDAILLKRAEVSISRFDLNVEQGKIEEPLKPMLRFATPLFDSGGVKKGILVLNYLGARSLDRFSEAAFGQTGARAMLLDAEGYWLKGTRRADEWGFMFKNPRTFARSFPNAWKTVSAHKSGLHEDAYGLFFFETVRPRTVLNACDGRTVSHCHGSEFWKVVSFVPASVRAGRLVGTNTWVLTTEGGLLIALVWLTGLVLIRSRIRDDRYVGELQTSREALASVNKSLELEITDRTSEITRLLAQKDAFIAQLGHDLRTPLTPMVALLPKFKERIDPKSAEALSMMIDNARHMRNLVDDTLILAQLNTPGYKLDFTDIDLLVETRNIAAAFTDQLDENSITVDNHINAPVLVRADQLRVRDVLYRIISNCVTYMGGPGTIVVEARAGNSNMVTLSISDTGRGMTPEEVSHAFEEFYKADPSRHDRSATGLGLAICRRIVEMHNGKIWIQSSGTQQGTTVFLMLPTARKTPVH